MHFWYFWFALQVVKTLWKDVVTSTKAQKLYLPKNLKHCLQFNCLYQSSLFLTLIRILGTTAAYLSKVSNLGSTVFTTVAYFLPKKVF